MYKVNQMSINKFNRKVNDFEIQERSEKELFEEKKNSTDNRYFSPIR